MSRGAVSAYGERYARGTWLGVVADTSVSVRRLLSLKGGRDEAAPDLLARVLLLLWLPWLRRELASERSSSPDRLRSLSSSR